MLSHAFSYHEMLHELRRLQKRIQHNATLFAEVSKYDPDTPAQLIFKEKVLHTETNGLPVLLKRIDLSPHTIGNHLGVYFDSIACAQITGMHFIGLSPRVDNDPFTTVFPFIIPHQNPMPSGDYPAMLTKVKEKCPCDRHCWTKDMPWEHIIPFMRQVMSDGLTFHLTTPKNGYLPVYQGLSLHNETDIYSVDPNDFLPLLPDVAIHYRCSDNLFGGMGCLSFKTILDRIPPDAKYIYIFSEYYGRLTGRVMAPHSESILRALIHDLEQLRPGVVVVVKRGSNVYTTMAIFAFANVTICSPSTFCLYPAIARTKTTYFPIGRGDYINAGVEIHPTFHFLRTDPAAVSGTDGDMNGNYFYSNFTADTTTAQVLETLRIGTKY